MSSGEAPSVAAAGEAPSVASAGEEDIFMDDAKDDTSDDAQLLTQVDRLYSDLNSYFDRVERVEKEIDAKDSTTRDKARVQLEGLRAGILAARQQLAQGKGDLLNHVRLFEAVALPQIEFTQAEFQASSQSVSKYIDWLEQYADASMQGKVIGLRAKLDALKALMPTGDSDKPPAGGAAAKSAQDKADDSETADAVIDARVDVTADQKSLLKLVKKYTNYKGNTVKTVSSAFGAYYIRRAAMQKMWFDLRIDIISFRNEAVQSRINTLNTVLAQWKREVTSKYTQAQMAKMYSQVQSISDVLLGFQKRQVERGDNLMKLRKELDVEMRAFEKARDEIFRAQWPVSGELRTSLEMQNIFPLDEYAMAPELGTTSQCHSSDPNVKKPLQLFNVQRFLGEIMAPAPQSYQKSQFAIASTGAGKSFIWLVAIAQWALAAAKRAADGTSMDRTSSMQLERLRDTTKVHSWSNESAGELQVNDFDFTSIRMGPAAAVEEGAVKEKVNEVEDEVEDEVKDASVDVSGSSVASTINAFEQAAAAGADKAKSSEPRFDNTGADAIPEKFGGQKRYKLATLERTCLLLFKSASHIDAFVDNQRLFLDQRLGSKEYNTRVSCEPVFISGNTRVYVYNNCFQVVMQCYRKPMQMPELWFPKEFRLVTSDASAQSAIAAHVDNLCMASKNGLYREATDRAEIKDFNNGTKNVILGLLYSGCFLVPAGNALVMWDEVHGLSEEDPTVQSSDASVEDGGEHHMSIRDQFQGFAYMALQGMSVGNTSLTLTATPFPSTSNFFHFFRIFSIHNYNEWNSVPDWYAMDVQVVRGGMLTFERVKMQPIWYPTARSWGKLAANKADGASMSLPRWSALWKLHIEKRLGGYKYQRATGGAVDPRLLLSQFETIVTRQMLYGLDPTTGAVSTTVMERAKLGFQQIHAQIMSYYTVENDRSRFPRATYKCSGFTAASIPDNQPCTISVDPNNGINTNDFSASMDLLAPLRARVHTIPVTFTAPSINRHNYGNEVVRACSSIIDQLDSRGQKQKHFIYFDLPPSKRHHGMDQYAAFFTSPDTKRDLWSDWKLMQVIMALVLTSKSPPPHWDLTKVPVQFHPNGGMIGDWKQLAATEIADLFYLGTVDAKMFYRPDDAGELYNEQVFGPPSLSNVLRWQSAKDTSKNERSGVLMYRVVPLGTTASVAFAVQRMVMHANVMHGYNPTKNPAERFSNQLWNLLNELMGSEANLISQQVEVRAQAAMAHAERFPYQEPKVLGVAPALSAADNLIDANPNPHVPARVGFAASFRQSQQNVAAIAAETATVTPRTEFDKLVTTLQHTSRLRLPEKLTNAKKDKGVTIVDSYRWDALVLALFNHASNATGKYFPILLGNDNISESITIWDTKNTYFDKPPRDSLVRKQVDGRTRRTCNQTDPDVNTWWSRSFTFIASEAEKQRFIREGSDAASVLMGVIIPGTFDCYYNREFNIGGNELQKYSCAAEATGWSVVTGIKGMSVYGPTGEIMTFGRVMKSGSEPAPFLPRKLKSYLTSWDLYVREHIIARGEMQLPEPTSPEQPVIWERASFNALTQLLRMRSVVHSEMAWVSETRRALQWIQDLLPSHAIGYATLITNYLEAPTRMTSPRLLQRAEATFAAAQQLLTQQAALRAKHKKWDDSQALTDGSPEMLAALAYMGLDANSEFLKPSPVEKVRSQARAEVVAQEGTSVPRFWRAMRSLF
jgi:hypothetical protein